ncbi:MAG: PAS domain S-box protein [Candidatus Thermoplasmatota archaeon]|nr:PAS domain S-box protein [Candidatus Thermoplasmatota archaeon]
MDKLKRELSYLILGQQGGENRIKILELLKERSYNLNQLSNELDLNYRTIEHHINRLLEYDLIEPSGEGYGKVYLLTQKMEENYEMLEKMKKKLETVSKSPKLYEKVVEQTHDGLILLDENKDVILINKSAEEITGYKDEDLLGKNVEALLESDIHQDLEQEVLAKDEFIEEMINIETKSGETKNVIVTMDYFHFDGDGDKGFSLLVKDITRETKQKDILKALMDHSEVMMAYLNLDFDLAYVNSAYAKNTDHSPEELVGMNHFDLFPDGENNRIFQEVIDEGESMSIKDRDLLASEETDQDGIYWALEPVKDEEKKVKGLVLSSYEVDE